MVLPKAGDATPKPLDCPPNGDGFGDCANEPKPDALYPEVAADPKVAPVPEGLGDDIPPPSGDGCPNPLGPCAKELAPPPIVEV